MRPARLIEITEVPIADIDCSDRLRPVSQAGVASLKASIETLGLQSEIHVRKLKGGKLRLIAGGHRLEVFRQLGRETIPSKLWDCTDDWARLAEIDDNLAHAELDTLELAVFLARRKEVYERAYPQSKAATGADLAAKRWNAADNMSVASFVATSAEKLGVTERQVRRLVAAGLALGPDQVRKLRAAPRKVTLADLQAIAKCGNPVDRYDICDALAEGKAKSAAAFLKARQALPGAAVKDPVEESLKRLQDAWARASTEARKRFVRSRNAELFNMLRDLDGGLAE